MYVVGAGSSAIGLSRSVVIIINIRSPAVREAAKLAASPSSSKAIMQGLAGWSVGRAHSLDLYTM